MAKLEIDNKFTCNCRFSFHMLWPLISLCDFRIKIRKVFWYNFNLRVVLSRSIWVIVIEIVSILFKRSHLYRKNWDRIWS